MCDPPIVVGHELQPWNRFVTFVTQIQVDIGDSNQGSGNQGPPAGTPSTPGQVNEEFWLNMTDPNPNTEPMGQSEFDKFLAKSK